MNNSWGIKRGRKVKECLHLNLKALISNYLGDAGNQVYIINLISELKKTFDCHFLVPEKNCEKTLRESKKSNINIHLIRMTTLSIKLNQILLYIIFFFPDILRIFRKIKKIDADIVYVGGGSWLSTAAPMPNGCSGGAVVNPDGELVGVATQTLGQVSHIRSIEDALRVGILGNDESHAFLPREVPPSLTASPNSENTTRSMKRNLTPKGMHRKRLEVLPHHHQKLGGTSVSSRGSQKENATPNPSGGGRLGRLWSEILTNYTVVRTGSVGRRNNGTQLLSKKTD